MKTLHPDAEKLNQINKYMPPKHMAVLKEARNVQEAEGTAKTNKYPRRDRGKYFTDETQTNC